MKYLAALLVLISSYTSAEQHWFDTIPFVGELEFFETSTNYQETGYIRGIGRREYNPQGVYHEMNFTNPASDFYIMGGASHDRDRTGDTSLVYARLGYMFGGSDKTNGYFELGPAWIEGSQDGEGTDSTQDASIELGLFTKLYDGNALTIGLQYAEYGLEYQTVDPLLLKIGYTWGASDAPD